MDHKVEYKEMRKAINKTTITLASCWEGDEQKKLETRVNGKYYVTFENFKDKTQNVESFLFLEEAISRYNKL